MFSDWQRDVLLISSLARHGRQRDRTDYSDVGKAPKQIISKPESTESPREAFNFFAMVVIVLFLGYLIGPHLPSVDFFWYLQR